ncbi:MAG: polysaccharide biosynthesis tyrosine autokinase [Dehalococcoidia bacterium]|nr:polysaccharide biosynthesis tyrosine autokinase [Dehalococcoidia bacterium]
MELKVYLAFISRRWWLLLLGPLLVGLAAYFVTQQMTPVYKATSTLLVNRTAIPGTIAYDDILTSERLTNTFSKLVERPAVLDEIIRRLELTVTRSDLDKKIEVAAVKETQLLEISVADPVPAFAATLANTTAQAFADDNASQLSSPGTVTIAKPAEAPEQPTSPKLAFNLAFAIALGLIMATGLGLLLDYLDDTVKSTEDVETIAGLPTLGQIGRFKPESGPAFATDIHSRSAEAYRQLRTNVHFTALGSQLKTIVITSANPEEGKSTTAANLATVLAQAGDRVILVDTDLRRSSLRGTFDGPNSFGLTGLLLNDVHDPSIALVNTRWKNLRLLPAGMLPPNPSELLTSTRMVRVIEALRELADYVIFDTPPVLAVTDAIILAARTDGTIVVAQADRTRTEALKLAIQSLRQANIHLVGVVLNKAKVRHGGDYYYRDDKSQAIEIEPAQVQPAQQRIEAAETLFSATPPAAAPRAIEQPKVQAPAAQKAQVAPDPAREKMLRARLAALRAHQPASPPEPVIGKAAQQDGHAYSNGHSNGNGHSSNDSGYSNGNGNGHSSNGNGHSNGNGLAAKSETDHVNGNGHSNGHSNGSVRSMTPEQEALPLSAAMNELLSRMDDTVGMIRSLKPGNSKGSDAL